MAAAPQKTTCVKCSAEDRNNCSVLTSVPGMGARRAERCWFPRRSRRNAVGSHDGRGAERLLVPATCVERDVAITCAMALARAITRAAGGCRLEGPAQIRAGTSRGRLRHSAQARPGSCSTI
jgi:hypothetical protein